MGMTMQSTAACPKCGGKGKIIRTPCNRCKGKGRVRRTQKIQVDIPAGVDDGQTVRVREQGSAGSNGGANGDLLVAVTIRPHALFKREGANVLCEMPISFTQAACGAEIEVPTLDGKVRYTVPEGTQTGTVFRLKGKGIPYVGYKNRGDQYVTVVVETPTRLTKEQKDLLRQFEEATEKSQPKRKSFFDKLKRNFG
jgi:molecular chaperone DnaJ